MINFLLIGDKNYNLQLVNSINSLANNERVELRGFGTFGIKHRMPKKARNPGTGEPVYLPERFVPTFKPSKLMRSRVNDLINK